MTAGKNDAVQIDSLRAALHDGLGLASDSDHVHHALALWTVASGRGAGKAEAPAKTSRRAREIGAVQTSASFERFLKRAAPVLAQIPESDYDDVLAALSNPAVVAALRSLNQMAAGRSGSKARASRVPIASGSACPLLPGARYNNRRVSASSTTVT